MIIQEEIDEWHNLRAKGRPDLHIRKRCLVIAQPRSGSTYMMRLAYFGTGAIVRGDINPNVLKAMIDYGYINHDVHAEIHMERSFENEELRDNFVCADPIGYEKCVSYHCIESMLFGGGTFRKFTMLGWGPVMKDYPSMLIDIVEKYEDFHNHKINIIFLVRDHEEIADSLIKKLESEDRDHPPRQIIMDYAYEQRRAFNLARRLDDIIIGYDELCKDPLGVIDKMDLRVIPPHPKLIDVINTKIP
jgi:hypothetical protein